MLEPDLASLSAVAVYAVVWGFVFVESGLLLGFFLPGDTVLFGAGLLTAVSGSGVSLPLLALGAFLAATSGDIVGYGVGRRLGRPWLERRVTAEGSGTATGAAAAASDRRRRPRRGHLTPERLAQAEAWTARWGALMVVTARWIPWLRTLIPVVAGVTRMRLVSFVVADLVGALAWAVGLPVLGHLAASRPWLRNLAIVVAAVSVLVMTLGPALAAVRSRWAARGNQTDHEG